MSRQRAKFEFTDNAIDLEIAGGVYTVTPSPDITETAQRFQRTAEGMISDAEKGLIPDADVITLCRHLINDILGAGSFDTIFEDRNPTLKDCVNLSVFILNEITAFHKK